MMLGGVRHKRTLRTTNVVAGLEIFWGFSLGPVDLSFGVARFRRGFGM